MINVTRDKRVHEIIEKTIANHRIVSGMYERKYTGGGRELFDGIDEADVLFSFKVPEEAIGKAHNLKWIHFASAGVEKSLVPALSLKKIKLTCSRGIHANTIAEYVLMQMLAFSKNLRRAYEYQDKCEWRFEELLDGRFDLAGKTVAVIGLGAIGRRIASLAAAFDMKVIGTVNRVRRIPNVDPVFNPAQIKRCIQQADFVILATPLTDRTYHIIDSGELAAMKPNAFLINVGRGKLVNEIELLKALQEKRIAGAALDVFTEEPLPPDSPFWSMRNVSITPHYSGMAENIWHRIAGLFCENSVRFKQGKRMLGIVNMGKGY